LPPFIVDCVIHRYKLLSFVYSNDELWLMNRYVGRKIGNSYGAGSGRIWLDEVQCSGNEKNITECRHGGWGRHDCSHSQDVSVSCATGRTSVLSSSSSPLILKTWSENATVRFWGFRKHMWPRFG